MKYFFLFLTTLLVSNSTFAYSPKDIYESLDVPEFHLNPGIAGISRIEKSVGGLTCIKSRTLIPSSEVTYECDLIKDDFVPEEVEEGFPLN